MDILISIEDEQIANYRRMVESTWTIGWFAPPIISLMFYLIARIIREFSPLNPPMQEIVFRRSAWWKVFSWREACCLTDSCYLYVTISYIIASLVEQLMWRVVAIPFTLCSILHYFPVLGLALIREYIMRSWKIDREWLYNETVCAKQLTYLDRHIYLQLGAMFIASLLGKYVCYCSIELMRVTTFITF